MDNNKKNNKNNFSVTNKEINVDQLKEEQALLNMLEDMKQDKEKLEKQRIATFNILEDVNLARNELKDKLNYIENLRSLLEKMTTTIDVYDIVNHTARAYHNLMDLFGVSFFIVDEYNEKSRDKTFFYHDLKDNVSHDYIDHLKKKFLSFSKKNLSGVNNKKQILENLNREINNSFTSGKISKKATKYPSDGIIIPITIKDIEKEGNIVLGFFYVSVLDKKDFFNSDRKKLANDFSAIIALNLERLRKLVVSEKARLSSLLERMSNAVLMFDNNKDVLLANKAMKSIVDPEEKGDISKLDNFLDVFSGTYQEPRPGEKKDINIKKSIEESLSLSKSLHIQEIVYGRYFFEVFITPVFDWASQVTGGALILHDITHLKEVDKMKTEFVSVASHQLRTPLTAIRWYIEELHDEEIGKLSTGQKDYITMIMESNDRMIKLVNDLLNVSRLETGRLNIEPVATDLIKLIQGVLDEYVPLVKARNCGIKFNSPKKLPKIKIDFSLVRQVVANLVSNAIKYSKSGNNKCSISVDLQKKSKYVEISVTDSGLGIPKKVQDQIFQKFFRADNVMKRSVEGTGLGLYISKLIVEASGGKISFKSEENKGTTFTFTLPLAGSKARTSKGGKRLAGTSAS